MLGCPIRKSADYIVCANPRSLSQLITSFVASKSLGIPHTLLFTFSILLICTQFLILLSQHVNELGDQFMGKKCVKLAQLYCGSHP